MRCVTCNRVLIPTPSGAVCLDHGGLVPLPVLVRELRPDLVDYTADVQRAAVARALLIAALPRAYLEYKSRGVYSVDGKMYRKAKHREGALVANYGGRRIWLWPVDSEQPAPERVVEVQGGMFEKART